MLHDNNLPSILFAFFQVKRYPWAVSYGNKHVDRAIESTKELLAKKPNISVPNPANMDAESAKSLLVFLLKVNCRSRYKKSSAISHTAKKD